MRRARSRILVFLVTLAMGGWLPAPTARAAPISFPPYRLFPTAGDGAAVAIADVTGDARRDVLMTTGFQGEEAGRFKLLVYRQSPQGGLYAPRAYATSGIHGSSMGVAATDLDGDGDADVAVAASAAIDLYYQHNGALERGPSLVVQTPDGVPALGEHVESGDFNRDGRRDLVVKSHSAVYVLKNTASGFTASQLFAEGQAEIEVGDVTGDGRDDVVSCGDGAVTGCNIINVFAARSNGTFVHSAFDPDPERPFPVWWGFGLGNVTGDGRLDVVAADNGPDSALWILPRTASGFGKPIVVDEDNDPEPVELGDMDGDGDADVVTLTTYLGRVSLWHQQGGGGIGGRQRFRIPVNSHYPKKGLALGFFNGNNNRDVAIATYEGLVVLRR